MLGAFFNEGILILVGTWWAFKSASQTIRGRQKIAKAVEAATRLSEPEQIRTKWYQKHYPEHVDEVVANGVRTRCLAKTYRSPADLDNFQAWCECPMCASIDLHWLLQEGWLIRQTRNGQEQDRIIGRQCRHCEGTWSQLI